MPASIRVLALVSLMGAFAIGTPNMVRSTEPSLGAPTIQSLEPSNATSWSYVVIAGLDLMNADGTCSVRISGVDSYVANCSPSEIRTIVPWTATSGDVVVSVDGVASNPVSLTVSPLQLGSSYIVSGVINFELASGSDLGIVLARQGDPPQAATAAGGPRLGAKYRSLVHFAPIGIDLIENTSGVAEAGAVRGIDRQL